MTTNALGDTGARQAAKLKILNRLRRCHAQKMDKISWKLSFIVVVLLCATVPPLIGADSFTVGIFVQDFLNSSYDLLPSAQIRSSLQQNLSFVLLDADDTNSFENYFKNETIVAFIGCMDLHINHALASFAGIYGRSFVAPSSPFLHQEQSQILSLGSSFLQEAAALTTMLTHFQWRNVHIVATKDAPLTATGNALFIYLSAEFTARISYVHEDAPVEEVTELLRNIKATEKAVVLCMGQTKYERLMKLASIEGMLSAHAYFIFSDSPYVTSPDEETQPGNWTILETVFKVHPVLSPFLYKTDRRKRSSDPQLLGQENFVNDAAILIDYAFQSFGSSADINKTLLFKNIRNRTLNLTRGEVYINTRQEILFNFEVYDFDRLDRHFVKIMNILQRPDGLWELEGVSYVRWPDGQALGPDECFHENSCPESKGLDALYILAIAIAVLFVVAIATGVIITVWRNVIKKEVGKGHNKVLFANEDLVFLQRKDVQKGSKVMNGPIIEKPDLLRTAEKPNRSLASLHEYADITDTARYNGDLVHVKEMKAKGFEMKNKVLQVVKTLRDLRHENVNALIGFLDEQTPALISDYCARGSLEDVLNNADMKLDWDFKISLLTDLVRGIRYIHGSAIHYHGNIKSRNCVIDSRWVLKLADFGMNKVFESSKVMPEFADKDLLWTAPEHLRHPVPPLKGSEKGDVYSCAIIMQQVILRSDPYSTCGLAPREIINKLRHPPPLLRPSVTHTAAPPQYIQIMKVCWSENPDLRPTIDEIYQQFKTITGGKKMNIVDAMFRMLEKYSTDLEDIVRERTLQLEEEKKKTDTLLYRMLPQIVAENLKMGQPVRAEMFSEVTIYFSDIVGFTTISAVSTPMEVVDLLNDLYTMFDATIDNFAVYKVETIGDAYMVASGLPVRNDKHAGEISTMALELLSQCGNFSIRHMPDVPLRVRIGLHSGPCVAGVVGLTMPRFCLFGDTVNTASRMESSGAACRIHLSQEVKTRLDELTGYQTEYRGEVELKGKGMAKTYWLTGKEGFNKPLPEPPPLSASLPMDIEQVTKCRKISMAASASAASDIGNTKSSPVSSTVTKLNHSVTIETAHSSALPTATGPSCSACQNGIATDRLADTAVVETEVTCSKSTNENGNRHSSESKRIDDAMKENERETNGLVLDVERLANSAFIEKERDSSSSSVELHLTPKKKTNIVHPVVSRTLPTVESFDCDAFKESDKGKALGKTHLNSVHKGTGHDIVTVAQFQPDSKDNKAGHGRKPKLRKRSRSRSRSETSCSCSGDGLEEDPTGAMEEFSRTLSSMSGAKLPLEIPFQESLV